MPKASKRKATSRRSAETARQRLADVRKRARDRVVAESNSTTDAAVPLPSTSTAPSPSSSEKRRSFISEHEEIPELVEKKRFIVEEKHVEDIVKIMLCPVCASDRASVKFIHHQLDTYMQVKFTCK